MTYEEDREVLVRYPLTMAQEDGDRAVWPWLPGYILLVCGPDEWEVCVTDYRVSWEEDGEHWFTVPAGKSFEMSGGCPWYRTG